ncbi:hypothetical protein DZ860_07385 [Vibrio sinensis]|uniref:Outer membrane protein beta-barrel domain-containing protein n=1 Tax=Vibrio sinensis TaxID=2302434 RepID=A0A3A6QQR4_9VIBR|nr:outer membrane beta-barrel protein [Vibrio sinensis]RJX72966.1 hypothetical protein DZ860_07385 [Vibrio sinensis]
MNRVIPLVILSAVSFGSLADVEHKLGIKFSRLDQTTSLNGFVGEADDKGNMYGIEYTLLSPISDNEINKVKLGVNLGVDITTLDYGTTEEADFTFITLAPVVSYSLTKEVDVYAKAGFTSWGADLPYSIHLSGTDFIYGLGITYQSFNGAYSGLEVTQFEGSDDGVTIENTMASIKVGYKF